MGVSIWEFASWDRGKGFIYLLAVAKRAQSGG